MAPESSFPALPAYTLALVALFAKTTFTSMLQVVRRVRSGVFPIPEDARLMGRHPSATEADAVRRCADVWRNDTENLPLFMALGLVYVLLGAPADAAQGYFGAYVVLRYVHTAVFLRGLQPWRALAFLAGLGVCWVIAVQGALLALARFPSS